jgi:hypothetical protein
MAQIWSEIYDPKRHKDTRGRVTIFAAGINPKSVFGAIELAALRANPNVTLDFM